MTETFKTTNPNIITHDNVPLGSKPAGAIKVAVADIDDPSTELAAYSGSAGSLLLAYSGEECTEYMWVSSATPNVPLIVAGSTGYWVAFSGGVVTDPGGSDTHVQYNDGGAFGGKSTFTFDPDTNTFTVIGTTSLKADAGYEPSLWVSPSGRLAYGFSTGTPTYAFSFVGTGGQSIGMERNTSADAGQEFVVAAGSAKSGATNAAGGTLRLTSGTPTGSGSGSVEIWTATAGASGTTDRAPTLKLTVDGDGNVNIVSGATYNINGSPHTHTAFGDLATEDITLATAYQPSATFYDSNVSGPAGHHKSKILYDSGVEIGSVGGFVIQSLNDNGTFKDNVAALWTHDKSFHWGGITRPDSAGDFMISSGKLEVVGYNIETNKQLVSTVATGTIPVAVASTTECTYLNAQYVNGYDISQIGKGWTPISGAWTRTADTTFTVDGNLTTLYETATKLKWTQNSTVHYAYVVSSSYAAGTGLTTVTIQGGSDFVLDSGQAISLPFYSRTANPERFPQWFDFTTTWAGFSSDPSGGSIRFTVIGRLGVLMLEPETVGVSNSASTTCTLPFTPSASMYVNFCWGIGIDNGIYTSYACRARIYGNNATVTLDYGFVGWTNSGNKIWRGMLVWEI